MTTTSLPSNAPASQGKPWTLVALIAVAAVANLNLAVANIAVPSIGIHFQASQTELNLVSVGFSLGLAGTVLYLGALGDRYGRKMMLLLGMGLTVPTALLAAWSPNVGILIVARLLGGIAAGMAYPTTLALITALWSGQGRTKAIALWSAIGGAMIALASVLAGYLLTIAWWGSVFLVTAPLALGAMLLAAICVPSHVNETKESVDHFGGVLSVIGILFLVLAINFAPTPGEGKLTLIAAAIAIVALVAFFWQQTGANEPLFDLSVARRRVFWVAAVAGMIIFGTLMGGFYVGSQFLQDVLGYSTLQAGAAVLPAAVAMVIVAPFSAKMIARFGSRATLLVGYVFLFLSFICMLVLWKQNSSYASVALAFILVGIGVGLAGTPASHSLTGSVPVHRAGMASGTADLQRDLGGSIMQSILGAILTAGYAAAVAGKITASGQKVSAQVASSLERSFSNTVAIAQQDPKNAAAITAGARQSFLDGANWAYASGAVMIVLGATLVWFAFPKKDQEGILVESYHKQDATVD
jgi:EmrB/QacA subfamily drug resistance transporter